VTIPDKLSDGCKDLICKLLVNKPEERLGYNNVQVISDHFWFGLDEYNFKTIWNKTMKAPFIPKTSSINDYI